MIEIHDMRELREFHEAGFKDDLVGICEHCGKRMPLKDWTVRNKLRDAREELLCKGCSISSSKGKYTDEDQKAILEKRSKTNLEKYGVENAFQMEKVKKLSSERDWTDRNATSRAVCVRKYGVPNPAQAQEVKDKTRATVVEKYGSVTASYQGRVEKSKATYLEHYGVDHNFKSPEWRRERDALIIKKYGRMIYSRTYFYDETCFDSSWELAYYIWLKDAGIAFTYQPQPDFKYIGSDGKEHVYHPDFLVNGEYQEVKGDQFFTKSGEPYCAITKSWWREKYQFILDNKVKILRYNDLVPMISYVSKKYGKDYLKSFKVKVKS